MTCQPAIRRIPGTWFSWPFTTKVDSLWPQAPDSNFGIQLSNTSRCVELERVKLHYRSANCVAYNPFSGQNDQMMRFYRSKKVAKKHTHTQNITDNVFSVARHPLDASIIHLKWLLHNVRWFLFRWKRCNNRVNNDFIPLHSYCVEDEAGCYCPPQHSKTLICFCFGFNFLSRKSVPPQRNGLFCFVASSLVG